MRIARTLSGALVLATLCYEASASAQPTCTLSEGTRIYTLFAMSGPAYFEPNLMLGYIEPTDTMFVGNLHGYSLVPSIATAFEAPANVMGGSNGMFVSTTDCDYSGDCAGSVNVCSTSRDGGRVLLSAHCRSTTYVFFGDGCGTSGGAVPSSDLAGVLAKVGSKTYAYLISGVADVTDKLPGYEYPTFPVPEYPLVAEIPFDIASRWSVGSEHAVLISISQTGLSATLESRALTDPATVVDTVTVDGPARSVHLFDQQQVSGPAITLLQDALGDAMNPIGPVSLWYASGDGKLHSTPLLCGGRRLTSFRQEGDRLLVLETAGAEVFLSLWNVSNPAAPYELGEFPSAVTAAIAAMSWGFVAFMPGPNDSPYLYVVTNGCDRVPNQDFTGKDPACSDPQNLASYCHFVQQGGGYVPEGHLYRFKLECTGTPPETPDAGPPDSGGGGSAGAPSTAGGGGTHAGAGASPAADTDGGCGCRMTGRSGPATGSPGLLLLPPLAASVACAGRRRRGRRGPDLSPG